MSLAIAALAVLTTQTAQLKPYADVITPAAKTQDGVFKVHQVGERHYFEIPAAALDKDMLWQAQETDIPYPLGGPGPQDHRMVRWARRGGMVYLMGIDASLRAASQDGIEKAIQNITPPAIIQSFRVETEGSGGSAVVDVSSFLTSDPPDLAIGPSWSAGLQPDKSYVSYVKAFPKNVEIEALLTFRINRTDTLTGTAASFAPPVGPFASVRMHYSFVMLPDSPMRPRFRDPRIGFFGRLVREIGGPENRVVDREMVRRFRLEKKDPAAAVSEPKQPIVFYISRNMPEKWRPYAIKGVEAWQPAFEQAGFKNAIIAKIAPTPEEDPNFSTEDISHSMIRWTATSLENAFGLQISDPRSGEVLSGQVVFYHNFLNFLQNMYFAQVGALDPRAQKFPFNDELMGELLTYIFTHEVGHTIGLEHNMEASSAYSIQQLRDPAYVAKHNIASSIMDYARFNYVAQPGDNVPLQRGLGEYDKFAVEWGYREFLPGEEERGLNAIAARQNQNPRLRFGNYVHPEDPSAIGEDISSDTVEAARLGFLNLRRNAKLLIPATVGRAGNYDQLASTYKMMIWHQQQLLDNVVRLVGGVYADDHLMASGGPVYRPVPAAAQRRAVMLICGPDGMPPAELLSPDIANRLFASGDISRVMNFQYTIMIALLNDARIRRMLDQEAAQGSKAYTVRQLLGDMDATIWRQLGEKKPAIDISQRHFQRTYLQVMDTRLNGATATRSEMLMLGRASLRALAQRIDKAIPKAADSTTALHLQESRRMIEQIIKGSSPAVQSGPPAYAVPPKTGGTGLAFGGHSCFSAP